MDLKSLVPWRSSQTQPMTREGYYDPFVSFRREIDRMFDDFFDMGRHSVAGAGGMMPAVDVEESDKQLVVTAELPGVTEKDIQVELTGDVLSIKGEKKSETESGNGHRKERRYGSFERTIQLPFEVKEGDIDAKFNNGVLTIRLPKQEDMQRSTRRIEVRAG
jgi:HSP20 family protein